MTQAKLRCVFVHGWGMNKMVWRPVAERLPDWIEPVCIDLPGHGSASSEPLQGMQDMVDALDSVSASPSLWVGWSLGGLAVIQLALQQPQKVQGMMLVAASPSFVERENWPCGMPETVFEGFATELENDYRATIRRFLSLQVKGSETGREILRTLRQQIFQLPGASPRALRSGLELLKSSDLRAQLERIQVPVSWLLGEQDGLVKAAMAGRLQQLMPGAHVHVIQKAAHAPFLSHTDAFNQQLVNLAETLV